MRTSTILLALTASILPAAFASPALNLQDAAHDALDWTAGSLSQIGSSSSNDNGGVHASAAWTFVDCGEPEDALEIRSIKVVPDPPEPGKTMTIYAEGIANQRIEKGAYADVVVKLGLIKLLQKRFDICDELANTNASMRCPIEKGEHTTVVTVDLPREIPKAKFTVNAQAYTQPPAMPMACATIIMDFMAGH